LRFALLKQTYGTGSTRREAGNAPIQAIFAIAFFMLLAMGVVQVVMLLYARNMVAASAHEGARAALELGRNPRSADQIARATIRDSTGSLLDGVDVDVMIQGAGGRSVVVVDVSGRLSYPGLFPFSPSITARASASKEIPAR
jgi:TadE-like protein